MEHSSGIERRRHRRLALALPVRFAAQAPGVGTVQSQGLTVDISPGGMRFETELEQAPRPESELRVQVAIPREREGGMEPVFISAGATVLRCEPLGPTTRHHTGARWSVAARFHKQPEISLPLAEEFPPRRGS